MRPPLGVRTNLVDEHLGMWWRRSWPRADKIGTLVAEQVASSPLWKLVASMVVYK